MSEAWRALGGKRRTLARMVYQRDRATPGYVCPGKPGHPCGRPIDWRLPFRDEDGRVNRWSKSVDHVHETQDGGDLTDLDNLTTVHLTCNSRGGATRRQDRARQDRAERMGLSTIIVDAESI